jgi:DNA-directed RNA polymerase specialized sigma24 family protein
VELLGSYYKQRWELERLAAVRELTPARTSTRATPLAKQVQYRLRPDEQAELVARYQDGDTVYALAKHCKLHRHTVSSVLERYGVSRRYNKLTGKDLELAVQLYTEGMSLAVVGERLGVETSTVSRALRKADVTIRPRVGGRRRTS